MFPKRLLLFLFLLPTASLALGSCKPLPSDSEWPSPADWTALNESISGKLLASGQPPGAVCHSPSFDQALCSQVQSLWTNASFHSSNPWTVDNNDVSCLPDPAQPCNPSGYPAYVVEAESPQDVQAAVHFANRTNVRLIVKGTGHDYIGRSTGPGTLSIWMHRMRGLEINKLNDPRLLEYGGDGSTATVKMSAGMQWGEVYTEASMHGITVVGGADPDVGIGGLLTAGGHSPISARFGFPADHVVEMEVVTADGELRTINANADPDLFWAMRGGGGFPFAILTSVTVKAFPTLSTTNVSFLYATKADSDTYWSMIAFFHSQLPKISAAGGMGYYFMLSNKSASAPSSGDQKPNPGSDGILYGLFLFPNPTSVQGVENIIDMLLTSEFHNASWATDPITGGAKPSIYTDFMRDWSNRPSSSVGTTTRLSSWLLNEEGLTVNSETAKTQLRKVDAGGYFPLLGNLVSGHAVKNVRIAAGNNSINPAWRDALVHFSMYMLDIQLHHMFLIKI